MIRQGVRFDEFNKENLPIHRQRCPTDEQVSDL